MYKVEYKGVQMLAIKNKSIKELNEYFTNNKITISTSFWGGRLVKIENKFFGLDQLIHLISETADRTTFKRDKGELGGHGYNLSIKISIYYGLATSQLYKRNRLTQLFVAIRDHYIWTGAWMSYYKFIYDAMASKLTNEWIEKDDFLNDADEFNFTDQRKNNLIIRTNWFNERNVEKVDIDALKQFLTQFPS